MKKNINDSGDIYCMNLHKLHLCKRVANYIKKFIHKGFI